MPLGDFLTALEMRDVLQKLVAAEVERSRPPTQYGTVTSIDRVRRKCNVMYPGATESVPVSMGTIQPLTTGQTVRIDGINGDRFVSDVFGRTYIEDFTGNNIFSGGSVQATFVESGNRLIGLDANARIRVDHGTQPKFHFIHDPVDEMTDPSDSSLVAEGFYLSNGADFNAIQNAKIMLSGGGVFDTTSTQFGWNQRFIAIGMGRGPAFSTDGYFEITMPADGTVIPGHAGAASQTVASGRIPIPNWNAVYYQLPIGQNHTSVDSRFIMVNYNTVSNYELPESWIPVVLKQGDSMTAAWRLGNGREVDYWRTPTFQNSWTNYGLGSYANAGYRKENGMVSIKGTIKGGTPGTTSTNTAFTLPVGFRPLENRIFTTINSAATAGRVDAMSDGQVRPVVGSTTWTSVEGISFPAEQ